MHGTTVKITRKCFLFVNAGKKTYENVVLFIKEMEVQTSKSMTNLDGDFERILLVVCG